MKLLPLAAESIHNSDETDKHNQISQQETATQTVVLPLYVEEQTSRQPAKRNYQRIVAVMVALTLAIALYFIWQVSNQTSASPSVTQQSVSKTAPGITPQTTDSTANSSTTNSGMIQVYIVGAVKHPGVYTLTGDARVYRLLQAAGGTLANANLVALNLAAKLSDGQEVYVAAKGEVSSIAASSTASTSSTTSTNTGQSININTASADEMRQNLHIAAATVQKIIEYRTQHGSFTSIDQLQQAVSKSIYTKIKNHVTIS